MIIFDGVAAAKQLEQELQDEITHRPPKSVPITIVAVLFAEDAGSQLYTRLKHEMAERLGIGYRVERFSFLDESARVVAAIDRSNRDWQVTGIIVQKPSRYAWKAATGRSDMEYHHWWHTIMGAVNPTKDVDGLQPQTLLAIQNGTWEAEHRLLPATCQAVLFTLEKAKQNLQLTNLGKTLILGKSDLVGLPLFYVLSQRQQQVELLGLKDFEERKEQKKYLLDAQVVVSATGREHLITPNLVREGVVAIDVGEPSPDFSPETKAKASFATPVPGGIGPLTVAFLMQNSLRLAQATETTTSANSAQNE